jgi:hypothetical protein
VAQHNIKVRILRDYKAEISIYGDVDVKAGTDATFPIKVAQMLIHDSVAKYIEVVDPGPGLDGMPRISEAEKAKCKEIMEAAEKKAVEMRQREGLAELAKLSAAPLPTAPATPAKKES